MRVVKPSCPYSITAGKVGVVRDKHHLHARCQFKLPAQRLLPQALHEEALVFDGHDNDTRDSLNKMKMFDERAHPFALLVNITDQHIG